jgi:cytochrome bd ubiquinol oxidase subunit II
LFAVAFGTIAISVWPYMISFSITIEQAAAPGFVFPLLLLYTGISFGMFRGKVRAEESNY